MTYLATMKNWRKAALLFSAASLLSTLATGTVLAQDADEEEEFEEVIEQVIVTGSRIKRSSTFTATSPLAVIDAEMAVQFGALDVQSMLNQSTSVSGQQIDSSFAGFGVDGGPGSNSVALRGLGPERTLVLMDGRRLGAAGNFGGTVFVDLSLIPSFLIERAEILLSGASSIYGADAVAGVVNIITPKNFEGMLIDTFYGVPKGGIGEEKLISLQFGGSSDRMRFFMGAEYYSREGVAALV